MVFRIKMWEWGRGKSESGMQLMKWGKILLPLPSPQFCSTGSTGKSYAGKTFYQGLSCLFGVRGWPLPSCSPWACRPGLPAIDWGGVCTFLHLEIINIQKKWFLLSSAISKSSLGSREKHQKIRPGVSEIPHWCLTAHTLFPDPQECLHSLSQQICFYLLAICASFALQLTGIVSN